MPQIQKQKIFLNILSIIFITGVVFVIGVPRVTDIINEPSIAPNSKVKIFELPTPELETSNTPLEKPEEQETAIKNLVEDAQQVIQESKNSSEPEKKEVKKYIPQAEIYEDSLEKVVNLLCSGTGNEVIVVTGFLISAKGHILTNAHVSDPLDEKSCQVRKGSPAKTFAIAEEIFRPRAYIEAVEEEDLQTRAQNDISIWKITSSSGGTPLPETFSHFNIDAKEKLEIGEKAITLSYPSELLGFDTILRNLGLLFTQTEIVDMDNTFILTKNTLSSQSGSSGGALISQFSGEPIGIIFGVEKDKEIAERTLFSLSTQAIETIVERETFLPLETFLLAN